MLESENSRVFDTSLITNFTRKDAYECRIPKIRTPLQYEIKHANKPLASACDPLSTAFIPPQDLLRHWSDLIRQRQQIAAGTAYIQSNIGIYDDGAVQTALRLHKALHVKKSVEQEIDWFARSYLKPKSVSSHPSDESLERFKTLIWSTGGYGASIPRIGLSPSELSVLCGNQHLSCDHMMWFQNKLNQIQGTTLVLYLNYCCRNTERIIARLKSLHPSNTTSIVLMMNVGKHENGEVFLGSDDQQGNHFTLCHIDSSQNTVIYCDSLGWRPPRDLVAHIQRVYQVVFKQEMGDCTISCCHDYNLMRGSHFCNKSKCSTFYPLQTCGNICGVVVIIGAVVAALARPFFDHLTTIHDSSKQHVPFLYLQKPTQCARYLRRVLMAWVADDTVSIEMIVPSVFTNAEVNAIAENFESDSDSEGEVVVLPL